MEITETALGNANIRLVVNQGPVSDLFDARDCALGKYAQRSNASHILLPENTEVIAKVIGDSGTQEIDQPFEYFVTGQKIPDRAKATKSLLNACST
ncbi:MAG: hypothetical protein AAF423_13495 [Pseudomonadota bacterium]